MLISHSHLYLVEKAARMVGRGTEISQTAFDLIGNQFCVEKVDLFWSIPLFYVFTRIKGAISYGKWKTSKRSRDVRITSKKIYHF